VWGAGRLAVLGDRATPARAWEEHAQITAFVLAGDAAAAADVVTRHLVRAGHDLHRRLGGGALPAARRVQPFGGTGAV
jgi:DNA-binding GntR family transcriptional regulator